MELILRYIELLELCRSELYDPFLADIEERCLEEIGVLLRHNKNHDPVTGRFTFGKQYIDVTEEYKNRATPGEGSLTYDVGYNLRTHKEEIDFAQWLHNEFGGDIHLLSESKEDGVKMPDYIWNEKMWDLKIISSEKAANTAIKRGQTQIKKNPGGIILDLKEKEFSQDLLIEIINNRMKWYSENVGDIMIISNRKVFKVLRYKK